MWLEVVSNLSLNHKNTENLKYTEVFTVNITTVDTLVLPEYFGLVSGRKENKIEKAGVHVTCYEFVVSSVMKVEAWSKMEDRYAFWILQKDVLITVEGYFKPEEWTDSKSGEKRNRIVMVATKFYPTPEKEETSD